MGGVGDNGGFRGRVERQYREAFRNACGRGGIANAYCFPGGGMRGALGEGAGRGVRVRLLLEGRVEYRLQHYASQALYDELLQAGIEIGGHALTRARLARLDESGQRREIGKCSRYIQKRLGEAPRAFAYPYGSILDYNDMSKMLLEEFGFSIGVSSRYGVNYPDCDPLDLRRIVIDSTDTLECVQDKVTGRLDPLAVLDSRLGAYSRRFVNRLLGTS